MNEEINIQVPNREEFYSKKAHETYMRFINEYFSQLKIDFEDGRERV